MLDIAILEGARTPFVKAYGPLAPGPPRNSAGSRWSRRCAARGLRPDQIDQVVFGSVVQPAARRQHRRVVALKARRPGPTASPTPFSEIAPRHGGHHHGRPAHPAR